MKLYRGLKGSVYREFDSHVKKRLHTAWSKVLKIREMGGLNYPETLNNEILELSRIQNLAKQDFTDNKDIALEYIKDDGGVLVEIDVNPKDILKYFIIEFQNFSKRRDLFELVYTINSKDLQRNSKKWNLKVNKFN